MLLPLFELILVMTERLKEMNEQELSKVLEALLFVAGKEIKLEKLVDVLQLEEKVIQQALFHLQKEYQRAQRGIQIREIAEGYQMTTIPEVAPYLEKLYKSVTTTTLSSAALETLAIIAYKQPLTRAEIERIRGVKTEKPLNTLLEKGLIREVGRKETIGKPILYGTTNLFLQHFGLKDLTRLPPLTEGKFI